MSQMFVCDGCGKTSDLPLATLGRVVKRDYCDDCRPRAEEFTLEVDEARKQVSASFKIELAALSEKYEAGGFKLPDMVDKVAPLKVVNG